MRSVGLSFLAWLALGGALTQAADFTARRIHDADHSSVQAMDQPGEAFAEKTGGVTSAYRTLHGAGEP